MAICEALKFGILVFLEKFLKIKEKALPSPTEWQKIIALNDFSFKGRRFP